MKKAEHITVQVVAGAYCMMQLILGQEFHKDLRDLSAGNRTIRTESTIPITTFNAVGRCPNHSICIPLAISHIAELAAARHLRLPSAATSRLREHGIELGS